MRRQYWLMYCRSPATRVVTQTKPFTTAHNCRPFYCRVFLCSCDKISRTTT